jgi:hypothetical protein
MMTKESRMSSATRRMRPTRWTTERRRCGMSATIRPLQFTTFTAQAAAEQLKKDLGGPVKGFDDSTYVLSSLGEGVNVIRV